MVKENVNFRVAAKAFILNKNREMLLIRRRLNDVMKPGIWEIPGGRMDPGENPFIGLKREAKEVVDLDIDIKKPF